MVKLRSYRFSRNTQAILARLAKKTGKTQNIVALRAFKMYEDALNAGDTLMLDKTLAGDTEFDAKIAKAIEN